MVQFKCYAHTTVTSKKSLHLKISTNYKKINTKIKTINISINAIKVRIFDNLHALIELTQIQQEK